MEQFNNLLKEFAQDYDMTIEPGWKEKMRRSEMSEALNLISKSGDPRKMKIAKLVAYNYKILDAFMNEMAEIPYYKVFYKSFVRGVYENMCWELDTFKRCLTGSLLALAKDERIEDFYLEILYKDKEDYEKQKRMIDGGCRPSQIIIFENLSSDDSYPV